MAARVPEPKSKGWTPIAGLLLLSLLLAVGAMRSDLFPAAAPRSVPLLEREALPFALLAAASGLFAAVRGSRWLYSRQAVVIGLGLFVVPSVLVYFSQSWISAFTRVALFSLTPVFAVVFEPYLGGGTQPQGRGALVAALVAMSGALCVFPLDLPGSIQAAFAFVAVIAASACLATANCYAVQVGSSPPANALAPVIAVASAVAAAGLVIASAATQDLSWRWTGITSDLAWSAVITVPSLILLFWLLPRMSATRATTRFVLAPLMAILIEMALERPSVGLRTWAGLLLSATGMALLLFAPTEGENAHSASLNL